MNIVCKTAVALSLVLALLGHAEARNESSESSSGSAPGWIGKAGNAVGRGANAAAHGIERGAKATARGVERGAKATARGVERGAKATAKVANRAANKVGGPSDK